MPRAIGREIAPGWIRFEGGDEIGGIIRWIWNLSGDGMFDEAEGERVDIC